MAEVIDDMQGLYTHVSEAYRAGMRAGADEAFRHSLKVLGRVSCDHECEESPAAFHAAEECCAKVRALWKQFDFPRKEPEVV